MLCMINSNYKAAREIVDRRYLGMMITPFVRGNINFALEDNAAWCIDNGCYSNYNERRLLNTLNRWKHVAEKCTFAVLPDVVANHEETLALYHHWYPIYKDMGYKTAFVVQNGATIDTIPETDAIFLGGDTEFKLSDELATIVVDQKNKGHWVHMGRVNSIKRIKYAKSIGCDSTDGTGVSRFMKTLLPKFIEYYKD